MVLVMIVYGLIWFSKSVSLAVVDVGLMVMVIVLSEVMVS